VGIFDSYKFRFQCADPSRFSKSNLASVVMVTRSVEAQRLFCCQCFLLADPGNHVHAIHRQLRPFRLRSHSFETCLFETLLRSERSSGMNGKLRTVAASNNREITRRDHSFVACSRHIHMGAILHAHPVRGESCIQCRADRDAATTHSLETTIAFTSGSLYSFFENSYLEIHSFLTRQSNSKRVNL